MTIQKLIVYAENRLAFLNKVLVQAEAQGNLNSISNIEIEIAETEETLTTLRAV
jgi:hypothetical protein